MRGSSAVPPPVVLNAIDFNDVRFDRSPSPLTTKLFLCSTQRTGSFLLCRAMLYYGLGIPHEYFNTTHISCLGPRFGLTALSDGGQASTDSRLRGEYIDELLRRRTIDGLFSAKLQWWENARYLDNPEGHRLLHGGRFIYLFREDLLAQAISFHVSMETGIWGLDNRVTSTAPSEPRFFDVQLLEARLEELAKADMSWRTFFARNGIAPLFLSYEQIVADLPRAVGTITARFGLPPLRAGDAYRERRVAATKANAPSAADIRANFVAQKQVIG